MRVSNLLNSRRSRQIQTKPEVDDRPDHSGLCNIRALGCVPEFGREFTSSAWIGFPEIDSVTQPIVIVLACLKRFACEKLLGHKLVTPVIPEYEGRRQSVQFLPVSFGDSSGGRVDPQFLKGFLCGFLGFCNFLDVFLARNRKSIGVGLVQHPWAHNYHFLSRLFLTHPVTISFCEASTPWRKATVQHPSVSFDSSIKPFVQI